MFCWAINQELCFMSILKKIAKLKRKKTVVEFFFEKVVGSQYPDLLKRNPTMISSLESLRS